MRPQDEFPGDRSHCAGSSQAVYKAGAYKGLRIVHHIARLPAVSHSLMCKSQSEDVDLQDRAKVSDTLHSH